MAISKHIAVNRHLAECVCQRLCEEINKLVFLVTAVILVFQAFLVLPATQVLLEILVTQARQE